MLYTSRDSLKVQQILTHLMVGVSISDDKHSSCVSITGIASVVDDHEKIVSLCNPILKAWFPDGINCSELVLIKVSAMGAEYWDSPNGKVATFLGMVKAAATGSVLFLVTTKELIWQNRLEFQDFGFYKAPLTANT